MKQMNLLVLLMLLISVSIGSHSVAAATPVGLSTYGNWCGLNHPVDIKAASAPIDMLDASCQQHDYCYAEKGQYACECDQTLTSTLASKLKAGEFHGAQAVYARSAYHYFKGSPCEGVANSKTGPTKLLQKMYNTGKNKAGALYDKVLGETPTAETSVVTEAGGAEASGTIEMGTQNETEATESTVATEIEASETGAMTEPVTDGTPPAQ
jgi:hypothetical protein